MEADVRFADLAEAQQVAVREIVTLCGKKACFNIECTIYPPQIDYVALLRAIRDSSYLRHVVSSPCGITWLLHDKSKLTGKFFYQMAIEGFYAETI